MESAVVAFSDLLPGHVFQFMDAELATLGLCIKVKSEAIPLSTILRFNTDAGALVRVVPLNDRPTLSGGRKQQQRQRAALEYIAIWWIYDQIMPTLSQKLSPLMGLRRSRQAALLQQTLDELTTRRLIAPIVGPVLEPGHPVHDQLAYRITGLGLIWAINEGIINLLEDLPE